jgi:KDO2-lipid IV(A) lauroyltransferase
MTPVGRVLGSLADVSARAFEMAVGALSEPAARRVGRRLGMAAHSVARVRRRTVERQLADSFPERDERWLRDTVRACYEHFGEEIAVLARPDSARIGELLGRARDPEGRVAFYRDVLQAGSGSVVVTAHLGNWELAGATLASAGVPVTAVVRRQRGAFDRRVQRIRGALGMEVAYDDESSWRLRRALRAGHALALVADQHAGEAGAPVPFLGRPASTFLGPARLCLKCRAPLFFGALLRDGEGYRIYLDRIDEEGGAGDEVELTRAWVARLEALVTDHPEQYFWFHRRWKLGHAGTPEAIAAYQPASEELA